MPDHQIEVSDEDEQLLERVRASQGLGSIEQAAEWLLKTRLRRVARTSNGRGRALYPVYATQKEPRP